MRRIVILGCAGSGKSTLARLLGSRFGLPVLHLDTLFWRPGWQDPDRADFRKRIAEAHSGDAWVSEGNYINDTFPIRLPRADVVILLDASRWRCLARVYRRSIFQRGRPDLAEGCPEQLPDREFLTYIWNFNTVTKPRLEAAYRLHRPQAPMIRISNSHKVTKFIESNTLRIGTP